MLKRTWSSLFLIMLFTTTASAQMPAAITIEPANATAYDQITLYLDPEEACFISGSLAGLPSIAMHSGITTEYGYCWDYVIPFNESGANGQYPVLQPTGDGRFSITYRPVDFYGFPDGTGIKEICAVFNNGTSWNNDGRDFITNTGECFDFFIPLSRGDAHWELLNPHPTGKLYTSISFVDPNNGWVCASYGTMVHTSTGGETWDIQPTGTTTDFRKVMFIDQQKGWALGSRNSMVEQIMATEDGGATWTLRSNFVNQYILDIFFIDQEHGWLSMYDQVMSTSDGGQTWDFASSPPNYEPFFSLFFTDAMNGWALNYYGIYKTSNGGLTWSEVNIVGLENGEFFSIQFLDELNGWISGYSYSNYEGFVMRTTNGGTTWTNSYLGWYYPTMMDFVDENNGWVLAPDVLLRTTNGGVSWQNIWQMDYYSYMSGMNFSDENNGWIVGDGGMILHTENGGYDWSSQSGFSGNPIYDIFFTSQETGWAGGYEYLLKTMDGGESWEIKLNTDWLNIQSISFADENNGWALQESGEILHTTDGGDTWQTQYLPGDYGYRAIFFIDPLNGWATGGWEGFIYRTTNGGTSWQGIQTGSQAWLNDVYFVDTQTGWAAGDGFLFGTTDGGLSWDNLFSLNSISLQSVHFMNAQEGIVVGMDGYGYGGIVMRTLDGGQFWDFQSVSRPLTDVSVINENLIFACGFEGFIAYSTDGGNAWKEEKTDASSLNSIFFVDENNGWAAGEYCNILHYIPGSIVDVPESPHAPASQLYAHVYPNPVNTSTTFEYELADAKWVTIKLYNTMGQMVATVVDEKQAAGIKHIRWNCSAIQEGIYFYDLQAGNQRMSGKLVLE